MDSTETFSGHHVSRVLGLVAALVMAGALQLLAAPTDTDPSAYHLGPQDVVAITVWGQQDLSGSFTVEPDGSLTFPLVGRIAAGGRPLSEVETELRARLTERFVKNPQLTIAIEQYRSQQIFVMGEVGKPGTYPLTGSTSLLEALARAGSVNPQAGPEAVIVRPAPGAPSAPLSPDGRGAAEVIRVPLESLQRGDLTKNVPLRTGDTVFVPRGETVFVFGEVNKPGEYALRSGGMDVLQVLSVAGGLTERGTTKRLRLVRREGSSTRELKVKLTDVVSAGDTLVVGERIF